VSSRDNAQKHFFTPAQDDTLRRLNAQGHTDAEIAYELGLTKAQIGDRRRRLKIPANRQGRPWTTQDDAALLQWRRDGVRWEDVAERLGRPMDGCRSRYRRLSWRDVPSDDEQRHEIAASLVRAENNARWNSYRKRYKISSTWTPGDPVYE